MENEMNFECKEYASSCLWENRYSPEPYSFTKNILLDFIIRPHVDFKSIYLCIDFSLLSEIDNIEYHKTLYYTIISYHRFYYHIVSYYFILYIEKSSKSPDIQSSFSQPSDTFTS